MTSEPSSEHQVALGTKHRARPDGVDPDAGNLGDLDLREFRRAAHEAADLIADYLETVERFPVFPPIKPGGLRALFPTSPPEDPESLDRLLADYRTLIEPNATHWQHPGFLAYFSTTASAPGILAEMLVAGLGQNPMMWRTSPIGTELEQVVVDWLRQALGLPIGFDGLITDTASTSTLIALAAARENLGLEAADKGLPGRPDLPELRVYCSAEAHSSVDKAAMTLGVGRASVRRVAVDDDFALRSANLQAAITTDRAAGKKPLAIVATVGTTSSTAVDPVEEIARIAAAERVWLHVDAAYAGAVALIPERRGAFAGWEQADSIVVNPHKWFFTPLDASLLLTRRLTAVRRAFSLVPEYLRTVDRESPVLDYNEYTPQLGRRFRALKLWFVLRAFGLAGMRRRIEAHCQMASEFAAWVDADPDFERLAPVPFSTVCLRYRPGDFVGREADPTVAGELDRMNEVLMNAVNATGEIFVSHTLLNGRFTIRVAIGNLRTTRATISRAWAILHEQVAGLASRGSGSPRGNLR